MNYDALHKLSEELGLDIEVISQFIEETEDILDKASFQLIQLEENPDDSEIIHSLFRVVHTIKGNSPYFNLIHTKNLAHSMENLMILYRDGKKKITDSDTNILLEGIDGLKLIFTNIADGNPELTNFDSFNLLLEKLETLINVQEGSEEKDTSILWKVLRDKLSGLRKYEIENNLLTEIEDLVKELNPGSIVKKTVAMDRALIDEIFHPLNDSQIENTDSFIESIKENFPKMKEFLPDTLNYELQDAIEVIDSMYDEMGFSDFLKDYLLEKLHLIYSHLQLPISITNQTKKIKIQQQTKTEIPDKKESSPKKKSVIKKTMRIEEESLNGFLDFVGELVIVGEMFSNILEKINNENIQNNISLEYKRTLHTFNKLSDNLQKSILDIRKVPIQSLLQRSHKLVREISVSEGKKIKVITKGEKLKIDKSILESLDGPFVHLIRNAADHGIESINDRISQGKPEEGIINITAIEDETNLTISFQDDGKGMDPDYIKLKAKEKLNLTDNYLNSLKQSEIFDILFMPGYSTAEKVTDISGRGVGMDVVKKSINKIGGKILVESEIGKGTKFELTIPKSVTIKIITGLLVQVNHSKFIIPIEQVKESFKLIENSIYLVSGKGECLLRNNKISPIIRLSSLFKLQEDYKDGIGIHIENNMDSKVIKVDKLIGTRKIVIKDINRLYNYSELIDGAALLGEEEIAFVLNLKKLQ